MTLIINLGAFALIFALLAAPFVIYIQSRKYWTDPSVAYARSITTLQRKLTEAIEAGEFNSAHVYAHAVTALMRQKDPKAERYIPPAMKDFYDEMSGDN